jgi:hypothetical protein
VTGVNRLSRNVALVVIRKFEVAHVLLREETGAVEHDDLILSRESRVLGGEPLERRLSRTLAAERRSIVAPEPGEQRTVTATAGSRALSTWV